MSPISVCLPPAIPGPALALAAPVGTVPGAGTHSRNAHVWREIAYFLAGFEVLASQRHALVVGAQRPEGTRGSGEVSGREALSPSIPDGNHGDNLGSIK